jgi:hypothetical protein
VVIRPGAEQLQQLTRQIGSLARINQSVAAGSNAAAGIGGRSDASEIVWEIAQEFDSR